MFLLLAACAPPPPRDLVLVTLDTTRADATGPYGASPSPTPTLDALAARGLVVDEALTVAPLTLPAHASLLTGSWPTHHGIRDNLAFRLAPEAVTLAERLRDAGYDTAAFVGAAVLDRAFGLDQGFDRYDDGVHGATARRAAVPRRPGNEVVDEAVAWLAARDPHRPVFLWVHLYDAHLPHTPPARLRDRFPDPYAASVAFADEQVGRVLEGFAAAGRSPLVVVAGDHGEARGDHGELTHGWFVYRSTLRVPLVLAGPGIPRDRVAGPASLVDVVPTALDALGLPDPAVDGRSLLAEPAPDRVLYAETWVPRFSYGYSELRMAADARYSLVAGPDPELYDWRADPGQTRRLDADPAAAATLTALSATLPSEPPPPRGVGDPALAGLLEGLGYVSGEAAADGHPRDPKDRPGLPAELDALTLAARTRPPAEAVPLLEAFLAEVPTAAPARMLLARACLLAGCAARGLEVLAPGVAAGDPQARLLRAHLLASAGDPGAARTELASLVAEWPAWAPASAALVDLVRRDEGCGAALAVAEAATARAPGHAELEVATGTCLAELGRDDEAERLLRSALDRDPDGEEVRYALGRLLVRQRRFDEGVPLLREQLARSPERTDVAETLGLALYDAGLPDEAIPILEPVARLPEAGPDAPLVLADARLATGVALGDALALLDLAAGRAPDDPQVHAVRARVLRALGRTEEAVAEAARWRAAAGAR